MRSRLPLCPSEVAAVAKSAPCCHASVVRWLHGVDGNQGTDKLIRAALEELDLHPTRMDPMARVDRETRQLVMPAVDTPPDNPPATPRGEAETVDNSERVTSRINAWWGSRRTWGSPATLDPAQWV